MKYKNTRTGVVIDTRCVVRGGEWVSLENLEVTNNQEIPEAPQEEIVEEKDEVIEGLESITKKQIMQELDAFGVEYDSKSNKQTLYDLMIQQGE